mmetsp:Transcript_18399/g.33099  ORF Transcript_18399/g.33099 Transcript_18399/m.33099 type:complete len:393 (+) Transcript_18399:3543-4721(+)
MSCKAKYFGVHTARYRTVACSPTLIASSLNCCIDVRDAESLSRIQSFQAHEDTVMALFLTPRDNPERILSVSYSGEIKIFSLHGEELLKAYCCTGKVRHASLNKEGTLLATSAEGGDYNGQVELWEISNTELRVSKHIRGDYQYCEVTPTDKLFSLRSSFEPRPIELACVDSILPEVHPTDLEVLQIEHRRETTYDMHTYYACLFENNSSSAIVLENPTSIIASSQNFLGQVAFMYLNRVIFIMDMDSLHVTNRIDVNGSGAIRTLEFAGNFLYYSHKANFLTEFNAIDGTEQTVKTGQSKINPNTYYMSFVTPNTFLSCEESGMFLYGVPDFSQGNFQELNSEDSFQVTCCGLDISPSSHLLAAGDFNGQIKVMTTEDLSVVCEYNVVSSP